MTISLWSAISSFFSTSSGAIANQHWDRGAPAVLGGVPSDPVWLDTYTPSAGYLVASSLPYTFVMTAQDRLGDRQADTVTLATTTMVFPFH